MGSRQVESQRPRAADAAGSSVFTTVLKIGTYAAKNGFPRAKFLLQEVLVQLSMQIAPNNPGILKLAVEPPASSD
jgi:hypothetical protein